MTFDEIAQAYAVEPSDALLALAREELAKLDDAKRVWVTPADTLAIVSASEAEEFAAGTLSTPDLWARVQRRSVSGKPQRL
jgi:hypothetical protein